MEDRIEVRRPASTLQNIDINFAAPARERGRVTHPRGSVTFGSAAKAPACVRYHGQRF